MYLPNSICMESTTVQEAPVAEGLPEQATAIGDSRKTTQRQKHAQHWQLFTRAQFPGGRFPGKIWMPTNQIRSMSTGARVSRELHTRALQASPGI